jgi:hypothetical protein
MRAQSWVVSVVSICLLSAVVMLADERNPQCQRGALPSNLAFNGDLKRVLQRLYDASPTFRLQCQRIAGATNLSVHVQVYATFLRRCRAFTIFRRDHHRLRADVHLPPGSALIEMVAHEFEHIVEQIEGLDLRRLARVRGSGVREVDRDVFETDRAQAAGRSVMLEWLSVSGRQQERSTQKHQQNADNGAEVPIRHVCQHSLAE